MKPYYQHNGICLFQGDCREVLATLPEKSVHCVMTSPPYWSLRDYGVDGQFGLEATPELYVEHMVEVFRAVKRVLRDDGTCWINLGDSFNSFKRGNTNGTSTGTSHNKAGAIFDSFTKRPAPGLKPKDMVGIPWRVAFALQADGWYLRMDCIWHKANPMPESVTDRPTKAHEYLFLLSKRPHYFYDAEAIKEPQSEGTHARFGADGVRSGMGPKQTESPNGFVRDKAGYSVAILPNGRNKRSVWTISTEPNPMAHFATFPTKLVEPCILAGTSERGCCPECGKPWERIVEKTGGSIGKGSWVNHMLDSTNGKVASNTRVHSGSDAKTYEPPWLGWRQACNCPEHEPIPCTVLDPFAGICTTGIVAVKHRRHFIGIELNEEYLKMGIENMDGRPILLPLGAS